VKKRLRRSRMNLRRVMQDERKMRRVKINIKMMESGRSSRCVVFMVGG
jgi:hypothetical protein